MKVIKKISEMHSIAEEIRLSGRKIAIVPTMGYLHRGHASLMKKAGELADVVISTLFVNPTQFAPNEDFEKYPRDFDSDAIIAESNGVSYLFNPEVKEMYPDNFNTMLGLSGAAKKFEGAFRPSHFQGVATIVAKFFNATKPHYAVFGQKDYQQTLVIKQLVRDLNFDIKIVIAPTVREDDGLAMSSRNVYLSAEERASALILSHALTTATNAIENGERVRKIINAIMHQTLRSVPQIRIDYASSCDADTLDEPDDFLPGQHVVLLIAAYMGKTRLIDNALISIPEQDNIKPYYFVNQ
jgi:pantoate--beta-alanine ligase